MAALALLEALKSLVDGGPGLTGPRFIKEDSDAPSKLRALEGLRGRVPAGMKDQLEQDIKALAAGISGEDSVAYELKSSFLPILVLRDLRLRYGDLTAQADFVVIAARFLLVIECKKLVDDVEISAKGDFYRCFKTANGIPYKKEGIYSPIAQNQRHVELLKKVVCESCRGMNGKRLEGLVRSVVVLANHKTVLRDSQAPAAVRESIIKCDGLVSYMKALLEGGKKAPSLTEREMYEIAETLRGLHEPEAPDYTRKYGAPSRPRPGAQRTPNREAAPAAPAKPVPPAPEAAEAPFCCPRCGSPMVLRTAKKGANAGQPFYGCSRYPACRQIVDVHGNVVKKG